MDADSESPPRNANGPLAGAARGRREETTGETLPVRRSHVKHPVRLFLAKLPLGLDRLAWLGLPNYRRDGWKEEK